MNFGDFIKKCRLDREWTQPQAASKIDIEQSYLSKLETGKAVPSAEVFERLCSVYGIDAKAMSGELFPAELDRLRDIGAVRETVLRFDRDIKAAVKNWLIAGLVLMALGGGFIGLTQAEKGGKRQVFVYHSFGITQSGEPADMLKEAALAANPPQVLLERLEEKSETSFVNKGPVYSQKVFGGRRVWFLFSEDEMIVPPAFQWAWAVGFSFIFAALGCFYISRRWPSMHTAAL